MSSVNKAELKFKLGFSLGNKIYLYQIIICVIFKVHILFYLLLKEGMLCEKEKSSFESSIHVYRAMARMTQQDLANRVGVSRQTIIQLERNKYNPSLLLAHDIANVFGVTIDDVFTFKETLNDDVEQEA